MRNHRVGLEKSEVGMKVRSIHGLNKHDRHE